MGKVSLNLGDIVGVPKLDTYLAKVNTELGKSLSSGSPSLDQAISRLSKHGGKRLRPTLVIAAGLGVGGQVTDPLIQASLALELVHFGSLIHDDIIDSADSRWGIATISGREGIPVAIVAGDYLIARAYSLATGVSPEAAQLLSTVVTQLCVGQSRELADLYNIGRSVESMTQSIGAKSAALISAACQMGGLCAGLSVEQAKPLADYGYNLGLAFQLSDDLLDLISRSDLLGKPTGSDAPMGIYSLPILLGLRGPAAEAIKKELGRSRPRQTKLVEILSADGSLKKTITTVKKYNAKAQSALKGYESSEVLEGLIRLPEAYLDWVLTNLVDPAYKDSISQLRR